MPYEIERKFLVSDKKILDGLEGVEYRQAYISQTGHVIVRVRIAGDNACITLKDNNYGMKRLEYEYDIPKNHAIEMIESFGDGRVVEKKRYSVIYEGHEWIVDEFLSDNLGLVIAEIELSEESEAFMLPYWVGEEITRESRYYNVNLAQNPYTKWKI